MPFIIATHIKAQSYNDFSLSTRPFYQQDLSAKSSSIRTFPKLKNYNHAFTSSLIIWIEGNQSNTQCHQHQRLDSNMWDLVSPERKVLFFSMAIHNVQPMLT
eukprot:TRINITY_DN1693_c0_g1_i3.p1 TRINITY_DN1693_c0_g1~~TRINITY_DN1693_c0_g1_i3.p1  ORF type:complete len:102 (+),score=8.87 TRINITY_DN1693_c0_g1_i3:312-617(+)